MMKINKLMMLSLLLSAAMFVGCSSDSVLPDMNGGDGEVQLFFSAANKVGETQTRTLVEKELPASLIPGIGEFSMTLEGTHTDKNKPQDLDASMYQQVANGWRVNYLSEWEKIKNISGFADNQLRIDKLKTGIYDSNPNQQKYLNEYMVRVNYGETTGEGQAKKFVEGLNKPCFAGVSVDENNNDAETTFSIIPKRTTNVKVLAKLVNSCFVLNVTDWMLKYFTDIEIKISTNDNLFTFTQVVGDSGSTFNFKQEKKIVTTSTDENNETTETVTYEQVGDAITGLTLDSNNLIKVGTEILHIFVNPGQQFKFSGSAVKSQTGTAVEFTEKAIGETLVARSCYTIGVDCDTAGAGQVSIGFNEVWENVTQQDINVNPGN